MKLPCIKMSFKLLKLLPRFKMHTTSLTDTKRERERENTNFLSRALVVCVLFLIPIAIPAEAVPNTNTILMMGDSITKVPNDFTPNGTAYPELLNASLNIMYPYTIIVNGTNGQNASAGRINFASQVNITNPSIVTFMYGWNDLNQNRSEQDIIDDILWMANETKSRGANPYILLMINTTASLNTKIGSFLINLTAQANLSNISHIDTYDSVDALPDDGNRDSYNSKYYSDGTHLNALGNRRIANKIYNRILSDYYHVINNDKTSGWNTSNINLSGARVTGDGSLANNLNDSYLANLTCYWSMDETYDTFIHGISGTSNGLFDSNCQGTWNGAAFNSTAGKIGNGLAFNGVNNYR